MKMFQLILLTLLSITISIILILASYRTIKTQTGQNQKLFLSGSIPSSLPDGLYKGKVTGLKTTWQGKKFIAADKRGINIFKSDSTTDEKYPFKLYTAKGLLDNRTVIKIDYNLPENPFWLRFIVDEIVEISPNKFLGKLNVKLLPGLSASLGYFTLAK